MNNQKIVLLVGAGSTVADVSKRPKKDRPPLDKKFFAIANLTSRSQTRKVISYMRDIYNMDTLKPENDSLENIMAIIYADIFDPTLKDEASEVFQDLISLFNRRLAKTTNDIQATQQRFLYRIITYYLGKGIDPKDICIITFNQDLQIEKILYKIEQTKRWKSKGKIFNFPSCYRLDIDSKYISAPIRGEFKLFEKESYSPNGIRILKLHGSLNWYSVHRSRRVSPHAMFNPNRIIRITTRQTINPTMMVVGEHRRQCTLPVIVPPVTHKSAILHNKIKKLWVYAEEALKEADEITIFGYSCPAMDFESSNLIQRSIKGNTEYKKISIIDPDSNVLRRYIDLISLQRVNYYKFAKYFLKVW